MQGIHTSKSGLLFSFQNLACLIGSPFGNQLDRNVGRSARFTFHSEMTMLRYPALNLEAHMDLFYYFFLFFNLVSEIGA